MGTNAATITKTVIENAFEVVAVELVTIIQALRYLDFNGELSSTTREKMNILNKIVPEIKEDIPLSPILETVKDFIKENEV
jgi:histidine ammonia-lyase